LIELRLLWKGANRSCKTEIAQGICHAIDRGDGRGGRREWEVRRETRSNDGEEWLNSVAGGGLQLGEGMERGLRRATKR